MGTTCGLAPCCWRNIAHSEEVSCGKGTLPIVISPAIAAEVKTTRDEKSESPKSLIFIAPPIYPIMHDGKGGRVGSEGPVEAAKAWGGAALDRARKDLVIFFPMRGRPNTVLNRRLPRMTGRSVLYIVPWGFLIRSTCR